MCGCAKVSLCICLTEVVRSSSELPARGGCLCAIKRKEEGIMKKVTVLLVCLVFCLMAATVFAADEAALKAKMQKECALLFKECAACSNLASR
jgi:hypothetical protein